MVINLGNISEVMENVKDTVVDNLGPLGDLSNINANLPSYAVEVIIQLSATIILFLIVKFFFWKPITKMLDDRKEAIDKSLTEASTARDNAKKLELELHDQVLQSKLQIKEILDKTAKEANIRKEEIINEAKEEARRRLSNLETELALEKSNMEKEIRQEIVDIAFKAAEKIVAREIDEKKYLDVVDDILKGAIE